MRDTVRTSYTVEFDTAEYFPHHLSHNKSTRQLSNHHFSTMPGPLLNFSIFTKSVPHALRAISLAVFPPGFLILFFQGIASHRVNPAIGILPLFISSAFAALLLANEKKCGCQASGLMGTPIHLVLDLMIGIGLLVCLILDWVMMTQRTDRGLVMLGTYGTNFLICNLYVDFHDGLKVL
jgi:hypothetical protein